MIKINKKFAVKFIKFIVCRFGSRIESSLTIGPSSPAVHSRDTVKI
jgi:hypothetical protein